MKKKLTQHYTEIMKYITLDSKGKRGNEPSTVTMNLIWFYRHQRHTHITEYYRNKAHNHMY